MILDRVQSVEYSTDFSVPEDFIALIDEDIEENREALELLAAYDRGEVEFTSKRCKL